MKHRWINASKIGVAGIILGIFGSALLLAAQPQRPMHAPVITVVKSSATQNTAPAAPAAIPQKITTAQITSLLQVDVQTPSAGSTATASWDAADSTSDSAQAFLLMLHDEWSKYPTGMNVRVGLQHIYLVKNLTVDGQFRAAMPDPNYAKALYYDVSANYVDSMQGKYMRRTIHHEYSHYIEYTTYQTYYHDDPAWEACNTPGFLYGSGGPSAYSDPVYANTYHTHAGFISGYSESGSEEDRAEVLAWLMTQPTQTKSLGVVDTYLGCKLHVAQQFYAAYGLAL